MDNWRPCKLGDILKFQRGFDITKKEQYEGTIPIVSSSGITSYHNTYKVVGPGVVIGRKGTLGKVHYVKENYWPHDTTLWVKDFKGNNPRFIYYFLKLMKLETYDVGASNPTLNRNHLHKIKLYFPILPIQEKIVAILSPYDDLIEINTQRIEILEKIIDEIYSEWFVRMRFPSYENIKFDKGIPLSWRIKKIVSKNKFNFIRKNLRPFEGEKEYYSTSEINGIGVGEATAYITYKNKPSRAQYVPVIYSVWFARMKNTYKILAISDSNADYIDRIVLSSGFVGFSTNLESFPFLFSTIKSRNFHLTKDTYTTGATQESLTNTGLKQIKILFPEDSLIEQFGKRVNQIIEQIIKLQIMNKKVSEIRDLLLRRFVTGKFSVENIKLTLIGIEVNAELHQ